MVIQYRFRLYLIALFLVAGFASILFRLWDIQITKKPIYAEKVPGTRTVTVRVPGVRGEIQDSHGHPLARNRFQFEIVLNLKDIVDDYKNRYGSVPKIPFAFEVSGFTQRRDETDIVAIVEETVHRPLLAKGIAAPLPDNHLRTHYRGTEGVVPYSYYSGLGYKEFAMLAEQSLEIAGVQLQARPVREYVYESLASHTLGYLRQADSAADLDELRQRAKGDGPEAIAAQDELDRYTYYVGEEFGVNGIEESMDEYLRGKAGLRELTKNQRGIIVKEARFVRPKPGSNVVLTLDLEAQYIAETALRKVGRGAAVVMDPQTGAILAMASVPSFNPNHFIPTITSDKWDKYNQDISQPLRSRAISGYAPGSVFKIPVALAGALDGNQNFSCNCSGSVSLPGGPRKCLGRHGRMTLRPAIQKSCNSFFYLYGIQTGIDNIATTCNLLGLGKETGIPIVEQPGLIPTPRWQNEYRPRETWTRTTTAMVSIGQGSVLTSPLQMAAVTAAVANGGRYFKPRLISRIEESDGTLVKDFPPVVLHDLTKEGISSKDVETVRLGMRDVVNAVGGTARRAGLEDVIVAGKTGTAQYGVGDTHAWFVCFAPYDEPQYAVAVFVESGKSGGRVASPIARRILEELFKKEQPGKYPGLPEAEGHFTTEEEVSYEGDLWVVPPDEEDTADEALDVMEPGIFIPGRDFQPQETPVAPSIREEANLVSPSSNGN